MLKLLKQAALFISSYIIHILLFAAITMSAAVIVLGRPGQIENALIEANSYQSFIDDVIAANKQNQTETTIPFDDPEVVRIINDSFPSEDIRQATENLIDAVYQWLNGDKNTIDFTIDFTKNKQTLANELSSYAFNRLAGLSECGQYVATFNPFIDSCRPKGLDIEAEESKFAEKIFNDPNFLSDTTLTAANLPRSKEGKAIIEEYSNAPRLFQWFLRLPLILVLATIGSITLLISLSPRKLYAWQWLGKTLVTSSITLVITPVFFGFIVPNIVSSYQIGFSGGESQTYIDSAVNQLTRYFDILIITAGLFIATFGFVLLFITHVTNRKRGYRQVKVRSGLVTSIGKRKTASDVRFLSVETIPLQSSEVSETKKPKKTKKNKKYRTIPLK